MLEIEEVIRQHVLVVFDSRQRQDQWHCPESASEQLSCLCRIAITFITLAAFPTHLPHGFINTYGHAKHSKVGNENLVNLISHSLILP